MKKYTSEILSNWLQSWESDYQVLAPITLLDGTRTLGKLDSDAKLSLSGGALPMKPARALTPYFDLLFTLANDGTVIPTPGELPLLVVGFTAQDLACLDFVDKFFSTNYYDEHYFFRRKNAAIIGVSGMCGKNGELLKIAGKKCDVELIGLYGGDYGTHYVAIPYSELGEKLVATLADLDSKAKDISLQEKTALEQMEIASQNIDKEDQELLHQASALLLANKVPDAFWQDIAKRCINCTACTFCPTCTCFDIFDRKTAGDKDHVQRWRSYDSCLLASFMREASGHNPMGTEALRTRRRIHHRLAADVMRWGHITCYLCGRCDELCPSNIGIKSVCREMVAKYS